MSKRQRVSKKKAEEVKEIYLVASGDSRLPANQTCWAAQDAAEKAVIAVFDKLGWKVKRAHPYREDLKHGFIDSLRCGMDAFKGIPKDARLIVVEAVWQYSYHLLPGLHDHNGPVLTIANWSGQWPGLVGLLNLNASLTKMGRAFATLWSNDFSDEFFLNGVKDWLAKGKIAHDQSHVHQFTFNRIPESDREIGEKLAKAMLDRHAIMGLFDEGCMGMYNGMFDDSILMSSGIYKERLSQSALLAEMKLVSDAEAKAVFAWLKNKGMKFNFGHDEKKDLTERQVLEQCKMYTAVCRITDRLSLDVVGVQYQQGLKDMCPASDLAEGLLNNPERPPVTNGEGKIIRDGKAIPHFNEVDQGVGVDSLITNIVWSELGLDPATTLHDVRYGEDFKDDKVNGFVWVFEISGSVPPNHLVGGYAGAVSERQPPMFFPLGGGTIKGMSKPGEIVWSRVFQMSGALHVDIGRGSAVVLPEAEMKRRWEMTTPEWPIMNAMLHGVSRNQFMARHKSNHIQVVYAPDAATANRALGVKAAMFHKLGIKVHIVGDVPGLSEKQDKKAKDEEESEDEKDAKEDK